MAPPPDFEDLDTPRGGLVVLLPSDPAREEHQRSRLDVWRARQAQREGTRARRVRLVAAVLVGLVAVGWGVVEWVMSVGR